MWVPVHMDASAREGQRTEAFSQVMLMLFQTVSLIDLELTCNQLAALQGQAFVHFLSSGLQAHFSPGFEDSTQVLCFKASMLQTELSSQFWVLLF